MQYIAIVTMEGDEIGERYGENVFDYRGGKFHNDGVVQVISFAYIS